MPLVRLTLKPHLRRYRIGQTVLARQARQGSIEMELSDEQLAIVENDGGCYVERIEGQTTGDSIDQTVDDVTDVADDVIDPLGLTIPAPTRTAELDDVAPTLAKAPAKAAKKTRSRRKK